MAETGKMSAADLIATAPEETPLGRSRRARALRRAFMSLLAVFLLLGATGFYGVRSRTGGAATS
jgi:hypothetical protein